MGRIKKSVFSSLIMLLVLEFLAYPVFPLVTEIEDVRVPEFISIPEAGAIESNPVFQKGLSYSAWEGEAFSSSGSDKSLALLTETNTEWIAVCFSWVQSSTTSHDIRPDPNRTATIDSIHHAITVAHHLGLKVMLKPMVDTLEEEETQGYPTVWRGEIQPSDEWFESYSDFINSFAEFAEQNNVELFCVGCEFKATTSETEQWQNVISGVRERYSGPITYAADWTNYKKIEWWNSVDYVGIDAYFPLTLFKTDPTFEELKTAWTNHADSIENWISTINKPVIFTEIGYRSGDGTAMAPSNYWTDMAIDLQEQRDCYEAAFQTMWNRNWFSGFYWWTWIHDPTKGGPTDSYHTPQNKPTQELITEWYSMDRQFAVVDQTFTSTQKCLVNEAQLVCFHLSWETDSSNVANARVYVNGTEYVTNMTGWASFSASFDTVGRRSWTVTRIEHPQANGYKVTAQNPSIIWCKVVIDVDVDSSSFGITTVRIKIVNSYDGSLLTDAVTLVNGEPSQEIEPGIYETQIVSWSPFQQLTVTTDANGLQPETFASSTVHVLNVVMYLVFILVAVVILLIFLKRRHHNPNETSP